MYAETDFILALIKQNDWLKEPAEKIYQKHRDEIWTSSYTLVEIMMIAYRENKDTLQTLSNIAELIKIKGDKNDIHAAAYYVEEEGYTPFDAIHLIKSKNDPIITSDKTYQDHKETISLTEDEE